MGIRRSRKLARSVRKSSRARFAISGRVNSPAELWNAINNTRLKRQTGLRVNFFLAFQAVGRVEEGTGEVYQRCLLKVYRIGSKKRNRKALGFGNYDRIAQQKGRKPLSRDTENRSQRVLFNVRFHFGKSPSRKILDISREASLSLFLSFIAAFWVSTRKMGVFSAPKLKAKIIPSVFSVGQGRQTWVENRAK